MNASRTVGEPRRTRRQRLVACEGTPTSSESAPVPAADALDPVLATDPHRHAKPGQIHVVIGERAGDVVQRRQSDLPAREQERVVLRMRVGTSNDPVEGERVDETSHLRLGGAYRMDLPPKQVDDLLW